MPTFVVRRRVDAFVNYTTTVTAESEKAAAEFAANCEHEFDWREEGISTFDAREFATVADDGSDIDETVISDF